MRLAQQTKKLLQSNHLKRGETILTFIDPSLTIMSGTAFEHWEVKELINFPNPPIANFYPGASSSDARRLQEVHMYGLLGYE